MKLSPRQITAHAGSFPTGQGSAAHTLSRLLTVLPFRYQKRPVQNAMPQQAPPPFYQAANARLTGGQT